MPHQAVFPHLGRIYALLSQGNRLSLARLVFQPLLLYQIVKRIVKRFRALLPSFYVFLSTFFS